MKDFIITNKDIIGIFLSLGAVVLTIAGWLAVFWLGLWQQKKQLRNTAKMKVYEELYSIKKELDEQSQSLLGIMLGTYGLPFLQMSFEKNPKNPVEANSKAISIWLKYVADLSEAVHKFSGIYLKFWVHSDMWIGVMPQLKKAKGELFEIQMKALLDKLYAHVRYLQNQSIQEWNWEKWNRTEIEKAGEDLLEMYNQIAISYLDDYMGLIHNRLITPIFGYKKKPREDFANLHKLLTYKILTEEGIIEVKNKKYVKLEVLPDKTQ